jgi:hypothetical protein
MKETQIVRRLRAYGKETGPESIRGLRDDAAREIVTWRVIAFVIGALPLLLLLLHWNGVQLGICK